MKLPDHGTDLRLGRATFIRERITERCATPVSAGDQRDLAHADPVLHRQIHLSTKVSTSDAAHTAATPHDSDCCRIRPCRSVGRRVRSSVGPMGCFKFTVDGVATS